MPRLNSNLTKTKPYLFCILYICLTLIACQEEQNYEITDSAQDQQANPPGAEHSHDQQAHHHNHETAGTEATPTDQSSQNNPSFQDETNREGEAHTSDQNNEEADSASPSQTWQESEVAQRHSTVDVGGGNELQLHTQRVITKIEGHRARTIVDQIFYSPYERDLEGTFRYSLPVGASVSHYALYMGRVHGDFDQLASQVSRETIDSGESRELFTLSTEELVHLIGVDEETWGELRMGRVVSQADGREVYEDTTRQNVDPALVEQASPNQFQARVFPIPAQGYTRIVFAYDEDLARVEDELVYTFPFPEEELAQLSFQLLVQDEQEAHAEIESSLPLSPLTDPEVGPDDSEQSAEERSAGEGEIQIAGRAWHGEQDGMGPGGIIRLRLPTSGNMELIVGEDESTQAFKGRLTLSNLRGLLSGDQSTSSRALFVLDTSLSSQPTRFAINRQLLAEILSQNSEIREFAVLSFDLGAEWLTNGFVSNTAEQRQTVLNDVDQILLEGATRFESVTKAIEDAEWLGEDSDLFLLSDGAINWGTKAVDQIALQMSRINRFFAYRTGVGAENLSLYRRLTKNGAVFSCLTMESLADCATAHRSARLRLSEISIEGLGDQAAVVHDLVYTHKGGDIFEGSELQFAGQIQRNGQAELKVTLSDGAQEHELTYPIHLARHPQHSLAPRAWAELLVALMSESGQSQLQELIYALAQRYTILTKEVVLLVLESDEEYERYELESIWADTLSGIESIVDYLEQAVNAGTLYLPLIEQVLLHINPQIQDATGASLESILEELELNLYEMSLPTVAYEHQLLRGEAYHNGESASADYGIYMNEAEQRFADGLRSAAARALSSIVENDSANGVSLRLVAYRLYTWGFTGLSAELFTEVLRRRPYEPQSYRDLAYVSRDERPELAVLLYEIAARGRWDERFQQITVLVDEEYSLYIRQLERRNHVLSSRLAERAQELNLPNHSQDLRVILSWNTDNVDIDLWVTDPQGFKCFYAAPDNGRGGVLLDDIVQGFGPERFAQSRADEGEYRIQAHYYGNNGNRLEAETFIHVTVIKYAGTAQEEIQEFDALLAEADSVADIARIQF